MTPDPAGAAGGAFLEEMKRYVGFDADAARLLQELLPLVADDLPAIARQFYVVVERHPAAAAVFSEGAAQIARHHRILIDWLVTALEGPHDAAYYERRSRIGRRHVAIGLPQQYMFTGMNVLRCELHDRVEACLAADTRRATHAAVDKLLDLELAIMLRHYQLEAEERLVRRERSLQSERLTAMRTLSAGLAHEVRNPLNAAKLQLELLERRLRRSPIGDPRLLESTDLVHQEIGRLTQLLNEFLSFARPTQLASTRQDLRTIAQHVVELEQPAAQAREVTLELLPAPAGAPVEVDVDAGKLHQVVQNLVRNAVEASERGQRVEVSVAWTDEGASITVRDHGPGVPADVVPRIYEPFFSTKEGGTGMGMAIVHSLVSLHGGTITLSNPGGASFTVTLPARPDPAAAARPPEAREDEAAGR
ncbi:MAG TPA: protoglobin domain-containing protein [Kofleriaceae bacterium]|nr:protoglobin domain-containing protein [Kofleriaceae bacterium]